MDSVVHFEIPAENLERAQQFYKTCFNWQIQPMPAMKYTILRTGQTNEKTYMPEKTGFINGGMMQRTPPIQSPIITINVENMQQAIETIKQNQGTLIKEPFVVEGMGIAAYFKDTEDNILGLWQNTKKE
ncbi:MAG TPA: VOC family protein [Candidatus Nanoarchaeia archaeon]|nr:VOC family protein [Candidatus Nanoarchaeia archaeon]